MLPDYEEAIAQSMKQPPPPYSQVALTNQVVSDVNVNMNSNETQLAQSQRIIATAAAAAAAAAATTTQATIPSAYENAQNKVPPAYDEANALEISTTSDNYTAPNEMNHTNDDNLPPNGSNTNSSGRLQNQQ